VQERLRRRAPQRTRPPARSDSALLGKLFDEAGLRLTSHHAAKGARRYRYYVSSALVTGTARDAPGAWRLPAARFENLIAGLSASLLAESSTITTALENAGVPSVKIPAALAEAERLRQGLLSDLGRGDLLKTIIERVELGPNGLRMILSLAPFVPASTQLIGQQDCLLTREFRIRIKRRGVEMRFVSDAPAPGATNPDPVLLREIKRAYHCFDALVSGRSGSVAELASREGISDRYVSSLLPLAFLAPDIVEAIAAGTQPADLTAHRLIRQLELPIAWTAQKQLLEVA
jgi:site-specific DNA recombinase